MTTKNQNSMNTTLHQGSHSLNFNILDYLDRLDPIKETASYIEIKCPLCGSENFKITKSTGQYWGYSCDCMETEQGKKAIVKAIAPPLEQSYIPKNRKINPKAKAPKMAPIEGTVTLAKFATIPNDYPRTSQPTDSDQKIKTVLEQAAKVGVSRNQITQTTYWYSPTQLVHRYDWPDPHEEKGRDKTCRQCHINQEGEKKFTKGDDPWPLYRESDAIAADSWVLFQEGEKCVETVRKMGLISVTLQGSNWKLSEAINALTRLKDAKVPGVIFIADNDDTGNHKADTLLNASATIGFPLLVIPITSLWEDAPEAGDLADWVKWGMANGMNQNDFIQRLEQEIHNAVDRRSLELEQADPIKQEVEQAKILIKQWLLEDDPVAKALTRSKICRVYGLDRKTFDAIADSLDENSSKPKTKKLTLSEFLALPTSGNPLLAPGVASMGVTIFAGCPGTGKTTLAYDLAGAVLMGDEFLGEIPSRQGSVLFVACDESHQWGQDKLINRGIAGNVTDDKVAILQDWDVTQWSDLETTVEDMRPTLVIVDSFNAIHNDPNFDENSAQASQTAKKLERLSAKYCVPIVLIHHLGKSKDNKGVNKLRGSTAIAASVSSVLILEGEGTTKRLYQPKIRGSEPLNLMVEMDAENGRFRVTSGNVTDDETKSLKQKLIDLFAANPGVMFENSELRDRFIGTERKTLTNALNKILGTVIGNGKIIKRPSKLNQKFKVYGLECTTEERLSPLPTLSLSNSPLNSGDYEAENFTTQALGVVTSLSPDCHLDCHHLEEDKTTMTTETLVQSDLSIVTTELVSGDERESTVNGDNANVLTQTDAIADDTQPSGKWVEMDVTIQLQIGQRVNDKTFGQCLITGHDSKANRYTVEFPDKSVTAITVDNISRIWVTD